MAEMRVLMQKEVKKEVDRQVEEIKKDLQKQLQELVKKAIKEKVNEPIAKEVVMAPSSRKTSFQQAAAPNTDAPSHTPSPNSYQALAKLQQETVKQVESPVKTKVIEVQLKSQDLEKDEEQKSRPLSKRDPSEGRKSTGS